MRKLQVLVLGIALTSLVVVQFILPVTSLAEPWDQEKWLKKLEAAKKAEGTTLIQYDAQPNYANWGGITLFFFQKYGVKIPPDMKGSSSTMAALIRERESTVADIAYYNSVIAYQAGEERGVHQPYKPMNWEKLPGHYRDTKDQGLWFTVHKGVLGFVVNTKALEKARVPIPKCYKDLLDPKYKNLVAYDDPTVHGTAWEAMFAANVAHGGTVSNIRPGVEYLKKLDSNVLSYSRETSYNNTLRGELAIYLGPDGSAYKMKWVDGGPIEFVIPCEGTIDTPLGMGMVKWAKRPLLAKAYLDWLLSPEAQGIWADSFWVPALEEYMTEGAKKKMKPLHGSYDLVRPVDYSKKLAIIDEFKKAWLREIRKK